MAGKTVKELRAEAKALGVKTTLKDGGYAKKSTLQARISKAKSAGTKKKAPAKKTTTKKTTTTKKAKVSPPEGAKALKSYARKNKIEYSRVVKDIVTKDPLAKSMAEYKKNPLKTDVAGVDYGRISEKYRKAGITEAKLKALCKKYKVHYQKDGKQRPVNTVLKEIIQNKKVPAANRKWLGGSKKKTTTTKKASPSKKTKKTATKKTASKKKVSKTEKQLIGIDINSKNIRMPVWKAFEEANPLEFVGKFKYTDKNGVEHVVKSITGKKYDEYEKVYKVPAGPNYPGISKAYAGTKAKASKGVNFREGDDSEIPFYEDAFQRKEYGPVDLSEVVIDDPRELSEVVVDDSFQRKEYDPIDPDTLSSIQDLLNESLDYDEDNPIDMSV